MLPLLPQSPTDSEPPSSDPPEPHPQTPTPTASPEARPTIKPPTEPPELRIVEPAIPLFVPPTITARLPQPPPKVKKPTFSFLPLLPVEDPPILSAPVVQSAPTPPRRKFNMTFLPVNAMPEPDPPSVSRLLPHSSLDRSVGTQSESALLHLRHPSSVALIRPRGQTLATVTPNPPTMRSVLSLLPPAPQPSLPCRHRPYRSPFPLPRSCRLQ